MRAHAIGASRLPAKQGSLVGLRGVGQGPGALMIHIKKIASSTAITFWSASLPSPIAGERRRESAIHFMNWVSSYSERGRLCAWVARYKIPCRRHSLHDKRQHE